MFSEKKKKDNNNNNSYLGEMRDNSACTWQFCPLTQAWRMNCPFNCPTTPSNYKHDTYTVLLLLKLGW